MKNKLKLILIIFFAFISSNTVGQTVLVKGGLNLARFTNITESGVHLLPIGHRKGFHFGVSGEIAITDIFLLEAGPMLQTKGSHNNNPYNEKFTTFYLDVPILLKVHIKLSENISFYNAAGTYIGLGMSGNIRTSRTEEKIKWSESEYGLKRLDFGFSLGAGFIFKRIQFGFGFDRGLYNINADTTNSKDKTRNNVIRLSCAYRFEKKE